MSQSALIPSPTGDGARLNVGKHLETFKEEFASIGIQLGVRYDRSPIIVSDGRRRQRAIRRLTHRLPVREGERRIYFSLTTARFSIIWERGSPCFIFMKHNTSARADAAEARRIRFKTYRVGLPEGRGLYACDLALIRPDQHVAWSGDRLPENCDELLARVTGW